MKPPRRVKLTDEAIEVILPPEPTSLGPQSHPIIDPNGCKISAKGTLQDPLATQILQVRGWVNSETHAVTGTSGSGMSWKIPAVGRAVTGVANVFTVEITYKIQGGSTLTEEKNRVFIATGYGGSCPGGLILGEQRQVIAPLMPRYYKVTIDPASVQLSSLLPRTPVYLSYDVTLSTPAEPVWRDINRPDSAGHWTLRVRGRQDRLTAELVLQRLADTLVLPSLIFRCDSWSFKQPNILSAAAKAGKIRVAPA